jgi:hypothetical protein
MKPILKRIVIEMKGVSSSRLCVGVSPLRPHLFGHCKYRRKIGMEQIEKLRKYKNRYQIFAIIFGVIAVIYGFLAMFRQDAGWAVVAVFAAATMVIGVVGLTAADLKIEFLKQIETLRNEQKE